MENKKLMIPIILGVLLLCGIIFTVVYKKTSGTNPNDIQEEQTCEGAARNCCPYFYLLRV